jgi:aryl-alcohol dehydrogenase-like predicted oxidoreductase
VAQIALAWVLAQGDHILPIPGTKRIRFLKENVNASGINLTDADLAQLNDAPPPAGSRY